MGHQGLIQTPAIQAENGGCVEQDPFGEAADYGDAFGYSGYGQV